MGWVVGDSWEQRNLTGREKQLGGDGEEPCLRIPGTFVPGTKLCEFMDTKKEVSAQNPAMTPVLPCFRRFVAAGNDGLSGFCDSCCMVRKEWLGILV